MRKVICVIAGIALFVLFTPAFASVPIIDKGNQCVTLQGDPISTEFNNLTVGWEPLNYDGIRTLVMPTKKTDGTDNELAKKKPKPPKPIK